MTRLSLYSRDENPRLSIRLSVGQYCTVGSSAAADYQFRADGIEPVHCRIGCRSTGGYIECLDVDSTIVVDGVAKDRSRLTHGNTLRIGALEMQVDMPGLEIPARDFEVKFEDEEAPTTKVTEALDIDREFGESMINPTGEESATPNSGGDESVVVDQPGQTSEIAPHAAEPFSTHANENKPHTSDVAADSSHRDSQGTETESAGQAEKDHELHREPIPSTRSVTFQFDSAEPGDLDLSQSDIDEITQTSPHDNVMGNVDLEGALDSETTSGEDSATLDSQPAGESDGLEKTTSDATAEPTVNRLDSGVYTEKHWKWTSTRAISALRRILEADQELKIYQCDIKQIKPIEIEEYSLRWFEKQKCLVYLISHLDEMEINSLTRAKRWDERIGHPQAVTMFLALSPKRIVDEFFESIQACVLISEELELLRSSDSLET